MKSDMNQKTVVVTARQSPHIYYVPRMEGHGDIVYYLEPHAKCTVIDHVVTDVDHIATHRNLMITFHCADYAELTYFTAPTGEISHDQTIRLIMSGRHARARIRGVYAVRSEQQLIIQSRQEHAVGDTVSDVMFKGVVVDAGNVSYNGMIYVAPMAHKSRAKQYNMNLLMGEVAAAQVKSVPSLEVLANEVTCSHGTAAGQFNKDHLFYLQSRGVTVQTAKELLVKGFIADTIRDIAGIDEGDLVARIVQHIR